MKNFKNKIIKFISDLDSKVNARQGNKFYKIFKSLSLLLMLVGIPIIALIFGSLMLGGTPASALAVNLTFWLFMVLLIVSLSFWFYYSKWADVNKK